MVVIFMNWEIMGVFCCWSMIRNLPIRLYSVGMKDSLSIMYNMLLSWLKLRILSLSLTVLALLSLFMEVSKAKALLVFLTFLHCILGIVY